jgi:hypothetical protein
MPFRRINLTAVLSLDKIDFKGEQTNLDAVAKDIRVINKNSSFQTSCNRWKPDYW